MGQKTRQPSKKSTKSKGKTPASKKRTKKPITAKTPLNPRQTLFCLEYLKDPDNATQAAIRSGYSKKTAHVIACQNLKKVNIRAYIAKAMEERNKKLKVDADWVLERLVEQVNADLAEIVTPTGSVKALEQMPLIWRQGLISGFEVTSMGAGMMGEGEGTVTKMRLTDRTKLLEMVGKHVDVKAFQENVHVTNDLKGLSDEELEKRMLSILNDD